MKCCTCNRERQDGVEIPLTVEDRRVFAEMGQTAPESVYYCKPCHKIMQDPIKGAKVLSGTLETHLRLAGNPMAQQIAEGFYKQLVEKATKKVQ